MPHVPDGAHDTHDAELVAAFAAGDAGGDRLEQALALVASCADCAQLHRDLRSIAAAVHELPEPVRPRDFRITAEQASALRPGGLRAFLAALSGPRFSLATPIGSGLAALGIVAVLVASGRGAPATDPGTRDTYAAAAASPAPESSVAADPAGAAPLVEEPASPAAGANLKAADDGTGAGAAAGASESTATPDPAGAPDANSLGTAGLVLVFAGFALLGGRVVARRVARAP